MSLHCHKKNGLYLEYLLNDEGPWGQWSPESVRCPGADNFVKGARMKIEYAQFEGDDTGAKNLELACLKGGTISQTNGMNHGDWLDWQFCPANTAVCGSTVKIESRQGSGDDTALNGMTLICCPLD